jgi:hypothetical protein
MKPSLAARLQKTLGSVGDAKARVGLARALIAELPPAELRAAMDEITARAGMRESPAQVALLALGEALELRRQEQRARREPDGPGAGGESPAGAGAVNTPTSAAGAGTSLRRAPDWGTGRPLTLGERKSLARRPERRLLDRALRDDHPDVITELLVNPRLTEADVVRICAAPHAREEVLARVYGSPRWAARPRVRRAIVSNPCSPPEIALALVPLLARAELWEIAADARLPNAVRARALEVLRRLPPTPEGPREQH